MTIYAQRKFKMTSNNMSFCHQNNTKIMGLSLTTKNIIRDDRKGKNISIPIHLVCYFQFLV